MHIKNIREKYIFRIFWIQFIDYKSILNLFTFGKKVGHRVICIAVYDTSSGRHRYKVVYIRKCQIRVINKERLTNLKKKFNLFWHLLMLWKQRLTCYCCFKQFPYNPMCCFLDLSLWLIDCCHSTTCPCQVVLQDHLMCSFWKRC